MGYFVAYSRISPFFMYSLWKLVDFSSVLHWECSISWSAKLFWILNVVRCSFDVDIYLLKFRFFRLERAEKILGEMKSKKGRVDQLLSLFPPMHCSNSYSDIRNVFISIRNFNKTPRFSDNKSWNENTHNDTGTFISKYKWLGHRNSCLFKVR